MEIVEALDKLEETESKERYLRNAVDNMENSLDARTYCLGLLASNYIDNGKNRFVSKTFTCLLFFFLKETTLLLWIHLRK